MANTGGPRIEVTTEGIEADISGKHARATNANDGILQIPTAQRVGNRSGRVNTLRLQLIDEIYVTRVDVDERQVQVLALVADVGQLNTGIPEQFKLHRQVPIRRVRDLC